MSESLKEVSSFFGSSLLSSFFKDNENYKLFMLQNEWVNIVTPFLANESSVLKFEGNILFVQVSNSVFKSHLFMFKDDILDKINSLPFGFNFTDIRFQIGVNFVKRKPKLSIDGVNRRNDFLKSILSASLSVKEENQISRWVSRHVKNDVLRGIFKDFMLEHFKKRKGELLASYTPCVLCGVLCPHDSKICVLCENVLDRRSKHAVVLILKKLPHLKFDEVREIFPCSFESFSSARNMLISRYKDRIFKGFVSDGEKRRLLSLLVHRPLDSISDEDADKALKYIPRSKF